MKTKLDLIMQKIVEIRELARLVENEEGIHIIEASAILFPHIHLESKAQLEVVSELYSKQVANDEEHYRTERFDNGIYFNCVGDDSDDE